MILPVYLAGPSQNLPRVKRYAAALDELVTVEITQRWWHHFDRVRTDRDVPFRERQSLARANLDGIASARLVWILWTSVAGGSTGSAVELGYAFARGCYTVISGLAVEHSIFTSLADVVFEHDEEALEAVRQIAREVRP